MKKVFALFAAAVIGASLSMGAAAAEKTLAERHAGNWPQSVNGYVTKDQCKACHGDYAKLAAATAKLEPNPHRNHLGDVNCVECHKPDQAKPVLMCNQCHKFTLREKAAK